MNKESLTWVYSMSSAFPGEISEETIKSMEGLLNLSDDELAKLSALRTKSESLFLKKFSLPFLDENITSLTHLELSLQTSILNIRKNIIWLNEIIDRCTFMRNLLTNRYQRKSFDYELI
jgi:hypothetical protein